MRSLVSSREERPLDHFYRGMPALGGCLLLVAFVAILALPLLVINGYWHALLRLHLSGAWAGLSLAAILLGGVINIPVTVWDRDDFQPALEGAWPGWLNAPTFGGRTPFQTLLAVNVGGCVVPLVLAVYQTLVCLGGGSQVVVALSLAVAGSIFVCHGVSRAIPGIGIVMPAFAPALVSIGAVWLLLGTPEMAPYRAPAAFVAGVVGPLVGADLLRLRELRSVPVAVVSIGGAGTFDGIVLSGMLAALFA